MQAGIPHLGVQLITFNLSHLGWQPSSPHPEYIWFGFVHVVDALNKIENIKSHAFLINENIILFDLV